MTIKDVLGFSLDDIYLAKEAGRVRTQTHPKFPELIVVNYAEVVQYSRDWDDVTLASRGLILDTQRDKVVARPWNKFFNHSENVTKIDMTDAVDVLDKLDGSLGILYKDPEGVWSIATRGSFTSDQADHAMGVFYEKYCDVVPHIPDGVTYLFEIIYPENRIVVDYSDMDDLVFLGSVDIDTGVYSSVVPTWWTGPVAMRFDYATFADALNAPDRKGMEGYIVRSGNNIVKFKQQDYIELHRIVSGLSPKSVWNRLRDGETIEGICVGVPDEFHKFVEDVGQPLVVAFHTIQSEIMSEFGKIPKDIPRKEFAQHASSRKHKSAMFTLLDNRPVDKYIWDMIKPKGDSV